MSQQIFGIDNCYSEIFFTQSNSNSLFQQYITYNEGKVRDPCKYFREHDIKKYFLNGWANVPISGNKMLDLSVSF